MVKILIYKNIDLINTVLHINPKRTKQSITISFVSFFIVYQFNMMMQR